MDKLVRLYKDELLSFEEIALKTGIEWWTIKELFKKHGVERISLSERAQQKRAKDFDLIFKLHIEEKTGLNAIHRQYGYSHTYIKAVLKDKGFETITWEVNQ